MSDDGEIRLVGAGVITPDMPKEQKQAIWAEFWENARLKTEKKRKKRKRSRIKTTSKEKKKRKKKGVIPRKNKKYHSGRGG